MRTNDKHTIEELVCQLRAAEAEQAEVVQFLNGLRLGLQARGASLEAGYMADALNKALQVRTRLVGTKGHLQSMTERR